MQRSGAIISRPSQNEKTQSVFVSSSPYSSCLTSMVDMSGSVIRTTPAVAATPNIDCSRSRSSSHTNNGSTNTSLSSIATTKQPQHQHIQSSTGRPYSSTTHRFFPQKQQQRPINNGHNKTSVEHANNGVSLCMECNSSIVHDESASSYSSAASRSRVSTFFGFRKRFHRWHLNHHHHHHHNNKASQSHAPLLSFSHQAKLATSSTNTLYTDEALCNHSSRVVTLGGRWSPPWSSPFHRRCSNGTLVMGDVSSAIYSSPITCVSEENDKEDGRRGSTMHKNPQDLDGDGREMYESSLHSNCPTTRFFASKQDEDDPNDAAASTLYHVQGLEIPLDDHHQHQPENIGIYTGTLDRTSKKPHGRGKMLYFAPKENRVGEPEEETKETSTVLSNTSSSNNNFVAEQSLVSTEPVLIYDGQWNNGDWCGFGTLMDLRHGHTYQGGFFDNYKHGLGVLQYSDGRIYDGIFALGKFEGKGHLEYPDGTTYWGHWTSDGIEHGRGKKVFADGRIYDGEFDCGVLHGHGRMTFQDGSWYLGEWIDGEPNGLGIQVSAEGRLQFEGTFIHGKPIQGSSVPNGNKKSDGDFLCYRSSIARHGTLLGNIPKDVHMRGGQIERVTHTT